MRIGCLIQARLGSSRLPRKVLADIGGWPMIKHVAHRAKIAVHPVIVVTPPEDAEEILFAIQGSVEVYGSPLNPSDMVQCYLRTTQHFGWDAVIRITGDCPFIDPFVIADLTSIFESGKYDFVANDIIHTYPGGFGVEVISLKALKWAASQAIDPFEREHVSPWIKGKKSPFHLRNEVCFTPDVAGLKFSVDTQLDLDRARRIDQAKPADYSLAATLDAYNRMS